MTTNEVTTAGLVTQALDEIISDLQTSFKTIYGSDINLESNSPDGQMIGIFAQLKADLLDLITQVYNSFDPDAAEGAALDARVALNGIQRIGASYTIAPVEITVDRALTLDGIDSGNTPFTVVDESGNQFQLEETHVFGAAGLAELNFRASDVGAIQVQENTITSQVTVVVGVTVVNNPSPVGTLGQDEESDADLKLRRQISMAVGSTNSLDALRANLANIDTVTDSYVWENYTGSNDGFIDGHSIWAIVEGGADADIAQAIYAKRSAGCGMNGDEAVNVLQPNGDYFEVKFDRPEYTPLWLRFELDPKISGASYVEADVKTALVAALTYNLYDSANSADVVTALHDILPLFIPSEVEISTNESNWYEIIAAADPQHKFTLSTDHITIIPAE
jgi:uncharacterized phage protein gp47/JayE